MLNKLMHNNFFRILNNLEYGQLELITPEGQKHVFKGKNPGVCSHFRIFEWDVIHNLSTKGDIGFAEDYRDGRWDTDNLTALMNFSLQNYNSLKSFIQGRTFYKVLSKLCYFTKRNTLSGSRKNIQAHYDLGNDFYELWLDPTMSYSSALFNTEADSLQTGQNNKYDRILDRLGGQEKNILEIGCGWGGFAERAIEQSGHNIYGITLSDEQLEFARQRLSPKKAHMALEDYRHTKGQFDGIVSIEMFEAVGEKFWPVYFERLGQLMKKGGKSVIQTITIADDAFEDYRKSGDAIRSFIFPGGMLPSKSRFKQEAQNAGLKITDQYSFGKDYARTLDTWLENFDARVDDIRNIGFDENFIRLWRFYLASCSAGFSSGRTDVMQVELVHA